MNALLVIDMQIAYFKSPRLIAQLPSLVQEINMLALEARREGDLIINARTIHSPDKSTWTRNMIEDDKGFAFKNTPEIQNTPGLQLHGSLEVIKTRDNAFHGTILLALLREHDVTSLTIVGVSAHSCIFHTAAAAYAYGLSVTLKKSAIGDEDEASEKRALEYLQNEYRQNVL